MLKGMADLPSFQVFQAITKVSSLEDLEKLVNLRAKLGVEAIVGFKKQTHT